MTAGPMPWSGTRGRSRELGYAEAMGVIADLIGQMRQDRRNHGEALAALAAYADEARVQIPELFDYCTPRVTAMERVFGDKVTAHRQDSWAERRRLAGLVVEALIARPMFTRARQAMFHGDPHAGNLVATRDGRLAILDWSLTGRLTTADRIRISQILVGALALDSAKVTAAVGGLSGDSADEDLIARHVREAVMGLRWRRPPGPRWVIDLLDNLTRVGVCFPPRLLLFRKVFLNLQGVLADVLNMAKAPDCWTMDGNDSSDWDHL